MPQALSSSIVFVPLLSWHKEDEGSVGNLSKLSVENDFVDRFLLDLTGMLHEKRDDLIYYT